MDVNSAAFRKKCQFVVIPRYELFLALSEAATRFPNEHQGLLSWSSDVHGFFAGLKPEIRAGLALSAVVPSFFRSTEARISPEKMFLFLESLENRHFVSLFLRGLLHDEAICNGLIDRDLSLKMAINRIGSIKKEWLSYIQLYPFDPKSPKTRFFEWLLAEPQSAQNTLIELYREWWGRIFSKFWATKEKAFLNSSESYRDFFESAEFEEFSAKAMLKIRLGLKGDSIEAMRGGYKIACRDISRVFFVPSVFNADRMWSAIEREDEESVIFFPFLDVELLQAVGEPTPLTELDPSLMCRAIGDPTRFALLTMLSKEPQPAVSLAQKMDLTRATISHHVSVLREAGILSDDGTGRRLQINWENLAAISSVLIKSLK